MSILILDNYDSFTYNLVHLVESITDKQVDVMLNDEVDLNAVDRYNQIILSPGPGLPVESGSLLPLIKKYAPTKKILGVCLGHQAIAEAFGAKLVNLQKVYHGVASALQLVDPDHFLFKNIQQGEKIGRYHSWAVEEKSLPPVFRVIAKDEEGEIMALQHAGFQLTGVQFHPESILTPCGRQLLTNWLYQ